MNGQGLTRAAMARRLAQDLADGSYVNLGIGLPTLVSNYVPADREVIYHSENGMLGMGPAPRPGDEDPELINAGKELVTLIPGGAYFHHTDSFVIMRGGHLDVSVLGAFQVSVQGDLANWATDDEDFPPAVGGAMDLAVGAKRVLVLTTHTTSAGQPKLLERCTYPLTAEKVVDRIYTDLAVIDVTAEGFVVREMAEGMTAETLRAATGAPLVFPSSVGVLR
jgi:3-oxoadipate CoA-transferase beta subunit